MKPPPLLYLGLTELARAAGIGRSAVERLMLHRRLEPDARLRYGKSEQPLFLAERVAEMPLLLRRPTQNDVRTLAQPKGLAA